MLGHRPKIIFSPVLTFYNNIIQSLGTVPFFQGQLVGFEGEPRKKIIGFKGESEEKYWV